MGFGCGGCEWWSHDLAGAVVVLGTEVSGFSGSDAGDFAVRFPALVG